MDSARSATVVAGRHSSDGGGSGGSRARQALAAELLAAVVGTYAWRNSSMVGIWIASQSASEHRLVFYPFPRCNYRLSFLLAVTYDCHTPRMCSRLL